MLAILGSPCQTMADPFQAYFTSSSTNHPKQIYFSRLQIMFYLGKPSCKKSAVFLTLFKRGGEGFIPMFKNYVVNFV